VWGNGIAVILASKVYSCLILVSLLLLLAK
jgi:hypothetical protein